MCLALIVLSFNLLIAQKSEDKISGHELLELSNPDKLSKPKVNAAGFPSRATDLDVLPGFQNPPHGYGQVPFWWWTGDRLCTSSILPH